MRDDDLAFERKASAITTETSAALTNVDATRLQRLQPSRPENSCQKSGVPIVSGGAARRLRPRTDSGTGALMTAQSRRLAHLCRARRPRPRSADRRYIDEAQFHPLPVGGTPVGNQPDTELV